MPRFSMEKLHKAVKNLSALPKNLQILLGLAALLVGILAGGTITAYGGLLLVVLLWAICMWGLVVLVQNTWAIAFPGESFRQEKALWRSWLLGSLVGVAVIAGVVYSRRALYGQDAINYYAKQTLLFGSFGDNGFYGTHLLADNLLKADYKMFLNLFISVPYLFTGRSINGFMVCYALTCFVPTWLVWLMVAKKAAAAFGKVPGGLYYSLCMAVMALWPMFLWPATNGMPDFFGMVFVGVILLLTAEYRFEELPLPRLLCLFAATFALILTRRWYMYWVVAYYALYALAVLVGALRAKTLGKTLLNMVKFGLPSVVGIVLPLFLTFKTILSTDYADIYGAYYGGGFLENCAQQLSYQGILWLLFCGAGFVNFLLRKPTRWPALVAVGASLGAMVLFTHTQSFGYHQALLLAPAYFLCLFGLTAASLAAGKKLWAEAAVLLLVVGMNFGCALGVLPNQSLAGQPLFSQISLELTRREDLPQIKAVTDFVVEHCAPGETVYININSNGYSGSALAYSDPAHPALQSAILYENSVPSTHGFPTGIWTSRYVMVTDLLTDDLIGRVNAALRQDTPAAAHYSYVTEFPLNGVTLYCYERLDAPDETERDYFKALFADYDSQWPWMFSGVIDGYTG